MCVYATTNWVGHALYLHEHDAGAAVDAEVLARTVHHRVVCAEGSCLRLIDLRITQLGLRVIKKKKRFGVQGLGFRVQGPGCRF